MLFVIFLPNFICVASYKTSPYFKYEEYTVWDDCNINTPPSSWYHRASRCCENNLLRMMLHSRTIMLFFIFGCIKDISICLYVMYGNITLETSKLHILHSFSGAYFSYMPLSWSMHFVAYIDNIYEGMTCFMHAITKLKYFNSGCLECPHRIGSLNATNPSILRVNTIWSQLLP